MHMLQRGTISPFMAQCANCIRAGSMRGGGSTAAVEEAINSGVEEAEIADGGGVIETVGPMMTVRVLVAVKPLDVVADVGRDLGSCQSRNRQRTGSRMPL